MFPSITFLVRLECLYLVFCFCFIFAFLDQIIRPDIVEIRRLKEGEELCLWIYHTQDITHTWFNKLTALLSLWLLAIIVVKSLWAIESFCLSSACEPRRRQLLSPWAGTLVYGVWMLPCVNWEESSAPVFVSPVNLYNKKSKYVKEQKESNSFSLIFIITKMYLKIQGNTIPEWNSKKVQQRLQMIIHF